MSSPLLPRGRGATQAFTLIELLTVIAIIGILSGIAFGVMSGVRNRAAISKARSELITISAALDSYKRQYGDYPQTDAFTAADAPTSVAASDQPSLLFNALAGKLGPKLDPIAGKPMLELGKFSLLKPGDVPQLDNTSSVTNAIVDPWGRAYLYSYRDDRDGRDTTWKNASFLLLSAGPDGKVNLPDDGLINKDHADNVDNVYPN